MVRLPPRFTLDRSSAASDVYKRQDLYWWVTYRNFRSNNKRSRIPWEYLQLQFGAGYPKTTKGLNNFKINFKKSLEKVAVIYPEVNLSLIHISEPTRPY
eukprot:TRINITY_DN20384_c0_g1_i1.p1 TRINITY_DN20384_c0_g1~~TRINITY_DN20384_c0_g1_i1.p1  ORF type:complete len:108 (-),score=13.74 TRINITY_DN20384_c0_g1_i1:44-340(-)